MAVKRITRDWLLSAEMDLRSIERMLDEEFLAPVACFHAQQCVEKSLKAILEEKGCGPRKPTIFYGCTGWFPKQQAWNWI